jgi:hypothetical protein
MPGLVRGVARTAMIAGTATAVSNRVSRRQAGRWAGQDEQAYQQQPAYEQPPPSTPPAPPTDEMGDKITQLKQLGELKDQGILTEIEFEVQKQKILSG